MKKLFLPFLFALGITAQAETSIQAWAKRYSNLVDSDDQASKVVTDSAGNIIVLGSSDDGVAAQDLLMIKYSNGGVPLWTNRYNGPGNGTDLPQGLAVDANDNLFVLAQSAGISGNYDF